VVYNHTAEGNQLGPTLSFRGIDNQAYYRLLPENPRYYIDYTGTGNSLNMMHPRVQQLITDSLRYWVLEMHVDGFRFDLAATLARELHEVDRLGPFLDIIHQDPVLSQVKLIAEPWDLGEGGYQVGNFPVGWAEWNDKYRDTVRRYWKGDGGVMGELAYRLTGSSDLYAHSGRRPYASINFVTAHDGFTLQDLVSYNGKHNEANDENNRDGNDNNLSWNMGAEGPTEDPAINALRRRQRRNFMATLLLSQGVPMVLAADVVAHSQKGNNNAYCQDNDISWLQWGLDDEHKEFIEFVRRVTKLRKKHPVFHRRHFFQGRPIKGVKDILWLNPQGNEMSEAEWNHASNCLGMFLSGEGLEELDRTGKKLRDDNFVVLLNSNAGDLDFILPALTGSSKWLVQVDTSYESGRPVDEVFPTGKPYPLRSRSLVVLMEGIDRRTNPRRSDEGNGDS
jgi:glycogen operon protein